MLLWVTRNRGWIALSIKFPKGNDARQRKVSEACLDAALANSWSVGFARAELCWSDEYTCTVRQTQNGALIS